MGGGGFLSRHDNVYAFIPNLIGYARIICTMRAYMVAFKSPDLMVVLYFASFVCDELDGRFARMLNQTSTFGAVLDMVTDRVATTGLLVLLCMIHPEHFGIFLTLIVIDITSHWFHMYSSLVEKKATHKDVGVEKNWLLRHYYGSRIFMGWCCVSAEVCYLAVYLFHWEKYRRWAMLGLPALQGVLLYPPYSTSQGVPLVVAVIALTLPGTIMKQVLNLLQLRSACNTLVDHDLKRP